MKKKRKFNLTLLPIYGYLLGSIIFIILGIIFFKQAKFAYQNPALIQNFVGGFGNFGPLILIFMQALQVIFFVIPGQVITIIGGYLFGILKGTIYSFVGTMIGSIFVFYLGRTYGRPYVEKKFNKKELEKFDNYLNKKGKIGLFVSRLIPLFLPNDLISFAASLTKISYKDYIIISASGFFLSILLLTLLGYKISEGTTPSSLIIMSVLGILVLIFIFKDIVKIIREIRNK